MTIEYCGCTGGECAGPDTTDKVCKAEHVSDWHKSYNLMTRLTTPEAPYTGDQVREAMIAADVQQVMHHRCSLCQGWVFYLRPRGGVIFQQRVSLWLV